MSNESLGTAAILIISLPTVAFGGVSILRLWMARKGYLVDNPLRHSLWRAGHAHAGVLLILALVVMLYVDQATLSDQLKWLVRTSVALAPILIPVAFFLSVLEPNATKPNRLINLAYVGAISLMTGLTILAIGLFNTVAQ